MEARSYRPSRYAHWTEQAPEVYSYLEARFGSPPVLNEEGADLLLPGGTRVEVKAAKEWCATAHSRGKRRRGRFQFHGYESCDYFLFVLVRENGQLNLHLEEYMTAIQRFGIEGSINWKMIFTIH
jgi:hypothetical protein